MTRRPVHLLTDPEDAMEAALGGTPRSAVDALALAAFDGVDAAFETEEEMVRAWADLRDELAVALGAGWRWLGDEPIARLTRSVGRTLPAPSSSTDHR